MIATLKSIVQAAIEQKKDPILWVQDYYAEKDCRLSMEEVARILRINGLWPVSTESSKETPHV